MAGSWKNGGRLSLALGLLLAACLLGDTVAMTSDCTIVIYAQVKPKVAISAPSDAFSWNISPNSSGIYTKTEIIHVKANADWQLEVLDNDSGSKGYMREWFGNGYGERRLSKPIKISAEMGAVLSSDQPIISGKMTGSKGVDVLVTFTQEVIADDLLLRDGAIYRKSIAFVASPSHR